VWKPKLVLKALHTGNDKLVFIDFEEFACSKSATRSVVACHRTVVAIRSCFKSRISASDDALRRHALLNVRLATNYTNTVAA
jgi:hypothetical protein